MISLVMLLLKKAPALTAELREIRSVADLAAAREIRLAAVSKDHIVTETDIMNSILRMAKTWMIF